MGGGGVAAKRRRYRCCIGLEWLLHVGEGDRSLPRDTAIADEVTEHPGVIVGKTLSFWAAVVRFAGALVAREQFLPGVDDKAEPPRACWRLPSALLTHRPRRP